MNFGDTFELRTAKIYSSPKNENDVLPVVYGHHYYASNIAVKGTIAPPCIDTANWVYCLADHAVTSSYSPMIGVISYLWKVYVDGKDITSACTLAYQDYELQGSITTITISNHNLVAAAGNLLDDLSVSGTFAYGGFYNVLHVEISDAVSDPNKFTYYWTYPETGSATADNPVELDVSTTDQEIGFGLSIKFGATDLHQLGDSWFIFCCDDPTEKDVRALPCGKENTYDFDDAEFHTNIVDVIDDFLTVECGMDSGIFDDTSKAIARAKIEDAGYDIGACGFILENKSVWSIISEMLSSFLGGCFLNGDGKLVILIDDNADPGDDIAGFLRKHKSELTSAKMKFSNIINQLPARYNYDPADDKYLKNDDGSGTASAVSQSIFGIKKPEEIYSVNWIADGDTVTAVQQIIVDRFHDPIYDITVKHHGLETLHIDVGDFVVCSIDTLFDKAGNPLNNHVWRVLGVKPSFSSGYIEYHLLQTGYLYPDQYGVIPYDGVVWDSASGTWADPAVNWVQWSPPYTPAIY